MPRKRSLPNQSNGNEEKMKPAEDRKPESKNILQQTYETVSREYLSHLEEFEVCDPSSYFVTDELDLSKNGRFFRLRKLVLNQKETFLSSLSTIIDTAAAVGGSIVTVFHCDGEEPQFYIGVISRKYRDDAYSARRDAILNAVAGSIRSGLMGSQLEELAGDKIFSKASTFKTICAVSAIPAPKSNLAHMDYVMGLDRLSDAMKGKRFSVITIADPVSADVLAEVRSGYEEIKTALSPYARYLYSRGQTQSMTKSQSQSVSFSTSLSKGISKTQSISNSYGSSHSTSENSNFSAGLHAGIVIVGGNIGVQRGRGSVEGSQQSETSQHGETDSEIAAKMEGQITQNGEAISTGESDSLQFTIENRSVQTLLERVENHLKRISQCESGGAMQEAVYIAADDLSTATAVAGNYTAILRGEQSGVENARLNFWGINNPGKAEKVQKYLQQFVHPRFQTDSGVVTAATLLNSRESAQQLLFPQLPMDGIPVVTMAPFGRNVPTETKGVHLGEFCYLGQPCGKAVELNRDLLTAHTFITGSTGSGKSNVIYTLLRRLCLEEPSVDTDIPHFLVVEPAKGEYKSVFGGYDGVMTFGTNPNFTQLLQLNPFSFPKEIHVLEHIDRLTEIFNACWPMYAAMPAVLKEAIEESYISCGWNLTRSTCVTNQFPNFRTLLKKLPEVLSKSEYSSDTKGDYTGALVTRVKELTNGINGLVLCASEETSNEMLFDHNTIIDLSRVGSSETKALLMGILMIKLQEYRMVSAHERNMGLQHITVLEEAHHLLRRTSSAQTQDGANLQGKSVEMLTNAIAEMRTYGEGFVIADQAPDLLDKAVIRNTNTKIILRLPDQADRELVGYAAGLDVQQIAELSKLDTGVAAVYQNHWPEAVLCHVDEFSKDEKKVYKFEPKNQPDISSHDTFFGKLLGLSEKATELSEEQVDSLCRWIESIDAEREIKKQLMAAVAGNHTQDVAHLLYCTVKGKGLIQQAMGMTDPVNAQRMVDEQIEDELSVSERIAAEIRKRIFQFAVSYVGKDGEQTEDLMRYGGVM